MSTSTSSSSHQDAAVDVAVTTTNTTNIANPAVVALQPYKGFICGVFSGVAKLTTGHPFDTVKVRLQTADRARFPTALSCVAGTWKKEGIRGFYKGATPPLVGWMFMDSLMLGSLTKYREYLNRHVFNKDAYAAALRDGLDEHGRAVTKLPKLPPLGHAIAGAFAGWTVSFIAAPVEHVKARLQVQYAAEKSQRLYSGPIDCTKKILSQYGVRGLYRGLLATLTFRTSFFFWWGSYDIMSDWFAAHTSLSKPAINFWAGGLSAQIFWIVTYPSDVVKQRIMTDPLGPDRKFYHMSQAARAVYREMGWRGFWRGFLPCFMRAFPSNGAALVAFEGTMRWLEI